MVKESHPDAPDGGGVTAGMRENLARLRELGVDPYPARAERTHWSADVVRDYERLEGSDVAVCGRVTGIRGHGKAVFADLEDGKGRVQLFVKADVVGDDVFSLWKHVDLGDIVGARGQVMKTRSGEVSVRVASFAMLAKALRPLPEKWHGLRDKELRFRHRYLDLIANEDTRRAFVLRSMPRLRDALEHGAGNRRREPLRSLANARVELAVDHEGRQRKRLHTVARTLPLGKGVPRSDEGGQRHLRQSLALFLDPLRGLVRGCVRSGELRQRPHSLRL